jgi:hypothetical protein
MIVHDAMGLSSERVRRVLTLAGRAPSVHNTQPWRFRLTPSTIELHADPERRLAVADPDGVELRVSCGAALFNLCLGLTELSVRPEVHVLPDPARPGLLATIRAGGTKAPSPEQLALIRAIPRRRTNRRPFDESPVPPAHLHELRRAALHEGGRLQLVERPESRSELARLAVRAHRQQLADPAFRAELTAWSGRSGDHVDGVSAQAGGPAPMPRDRWVLRDFGGDSRPEPRAHAGFEAEPTVALLSVPDLGPHGDLRAGQALQRVLLTATVCGLSASLVSQLVEVPEARAEAGRLAGSDRPPHAVLRIGHGWPVVASPRRAVEDLLAEPSVSDVPGI